MPAISLRELDKHLEADKPFMFPHESHDFDDGAYDWEDYCLEPTACEEDHGSYDDYDPFEYYDPWAMDCEYI